MLLYDLRLARASLKRDLLHSFILVGGIALGVATATTFSTVRHALAKDPLPGKSRSLYYVRLDNWDPLHEYPGDALGAPPSQITYRDMVDLMRSRIPSRQSGMFKSQLYVSAETNGRPTSASARLCFSDFFAMFDVPFKYGSPWDAAADHDGAPVVVLSEPMNELLFGGTNSVGRTLRANDREFRVVGVLDYWQPTIKFYDVTQNSVEAPEGLFLPFHLLSAMQLRTAGNTDGWGEEPSTFEGLLASERCWIQMWVELPDESRRAAYEDFLNAYVAEHKKTGRFPRPLNNRVTPLMSWLQERKVVPPTLVAITIVSHLFLAVCSLNLTGLLLAKFLSRAPEVGVRRALGARRLDIFVQHLVECEVVGVLGGVLGLLLSLAALFWLNTWMRILVMQMGRAQRTWFFQLDLTMVALAVTLSLLAGLLAGIYPAWRVCRIAPARHLKLQ
jgi:putative ABC transport system permease protein